VATTVPIPAYGSLVFAVLGGYVGSGLAKGVSASKGAHLQIAPSEWPSVFGDAKMTNALLDRFTRHCDIVEAATIAGASRAASDQNPLIRHGAANRDHLRCGSACHRYRGVTPIRGAMFQAD
jgi:IstB-like ATP binding protein